MERLASNVHRNDVLRRRGPLSQAPRAGRETSRGKADPRVVCPDLHGITGMLILFVCSPITLREAATYAQLVSFFVRATRFQFPMLTLRALLTKSTKYIEVERERERERDMHFH